MSSPIEENLPPHEVARVATLTLEFLSLHQKLTQLGAVTEMEVSASGVKPKDQVLVLRAQRQHLGAGRDLYDSMITVLDEVLGILGQYF